MSDAVPVDNSLAAQVSQMPVNIFHGTRVSMAERILREGFAPLPISEQIEAVADHEVTVDELMADLKAHNRFAIIDPRPDTVFVTGNQVKAGSWADRAPEATWEALWAVYRIRHPELGWDWNNSQEGHLWVLAHRLDDPPAVVSATAPLRALRNRRGNGTAVDLFARVADATDPAKALETALWLLRDSPEWLVDPADITAHGSTPVSARVDDDLLYFISGETVDVFREQLRTGHWGERGASAHESDRPWHPFEQVWARLSRDRQSELGELVGVPITSVLAANAREAAELVAEA